MLAGKRLAEAPSCQ